MIVPVAQRDAVFKTVSSHSRSGLKQSAPRSDAKPANHPRFHPTTSFSPPLYPRCYVQTCAAINPADRAANQSKYTLSSFEAHAGILCLQRRRAGKCLGEWKTERQRNGTANYCGLMALHLLSPALTRVHFCVR